jgi:prepilin-type processing-associated H-X9-DG protein
VVIAIISIIAALLLPAFDKARGQGRSAACRHNMRQLALGFYLYADESESYLPWAPVDADRNAAGDFVFGGPDGGQIDPTAPATWGDKGFAFHAESGSVFAYVTGQPREAPHKDATPTVAPVYRCPSAGALGAALRVNFSMNGLLDASHAQATPRGLRYTAINNPSQKILLVNESPNTMFSAGFVPGDDPGRDKLISHQGRANVAFVDSHVESVSTQGAKEMMSLVQRDYWFDPFK